MPRRDCDDYPIRRLAHWALLWLCLTAAPLASQATGQEEDEAGDNYRPGLLAEYRSAGKTVRRTDDDITFVWSGASPDVRLQAGPLTARWTGTLLVKGGERFTFHAYFSGNVRVALDSKVVLAGKQSAAGWIRSEPCPLEYGYHPIVVEYESATPAARLGLFWESEQFELEPIPPWHWFHEAPGGPAWEQAARGEELVRAHRCTSCHPAELPGPTLPAPSLARLRGAVKEDWLVDYLQHPAQTKQHARMPEAGLDAAGARAVAAYLLDQSQKAPIGKAPNGSAQRGGEHVRRIGCLACHTVGAAGMAGAFGGGSLDRVADKRPPGFVATWLTKPEQLNAHQRMPVFDLNKKELADVSAYLATLRGSRLPPAGNLRDRSLVVTGAKLVRQKRCANCHEIGGIRSAPAVPLRTAVARVSGSVESKSAAGCLGAPDPVKDRPGYRMEPGAAAAVLAFVEQLSDQPVAWSRQDHGARVLAINNCLSCHDRGTAMGLRAAVAKLGVTDPKVQAGLIPPSLNAVGDKLHEEYLAQAASGAAPRWRPWLAPRMPKFRHAAKDLEALTAYFVEHDRIPRAEPSAPPADAGTMWLAAHRLVGPAGFGCMSCHVIDRHEPKEVEPGARGSDLRHIDRRMRKSFFLRWTRNPARIVPGMEMPAITLASPGVLDGKVRAQVESLWYGLNAPQFDLPTADAVQVLTMRPGERTLVLRDPFEHAADDDTTRPFAIGLENRHNLLLDLDAMSPRRWWAGDFARQKTRGKTWYWETAGVTLVDWPAPTPLILLGSGGKLIEPAPDGQAVGWLTEYEHLPNGLFLRMRLQYPPERWLPVEMRIAVAPFGFTIDYRVTGVPAGDSAVVALSTAGAAVQPTGVEWRSPAGTARIQFSGKPIDLGSLGGNGGHGNDRLFVALEPRDGAWAGRVTYTAELTPPPPTAPQPTLAGPKGKVLGVLPGYEVVRLPVPDGPMPTGFAWLRDGSMFVCSLKGEIYRVRDSDGDGLLDQYSQFSDHLAAPYGMVADGDDLVVCHKPELLRLKDIDRDGRADRSEVIATGWGVTFDYHDWLVGPVPAPQGGYYVSPPCQQDDRTKVGAIGRGKVLHVAPEGQWRIIAGGIRFAMGLARNAAGDLFATDNQGNANPFNELNHIRPGHHYGFYSKLEPRPPNQPVTQPAIQIPHPWSRSVNGIAFIPADVDFGPYAGQLIGADYTVRNLIRMSLQKVGDTYQGAAYPFSKVDLALLEADETFLGPVALGFGPDGCLYVGSMIDSGWGGGNNRGTIERARFVGPVPFGIREVRAHAGGFDIDFTDTVDADLAGRPQIYTLSCYHRIPTGSYETPDSDRTTVKVRRVEIAGDRRSVRLFVEPLKTGYVYDIAVGAVKTGSERLYPAVAYYTLNELPRN